MRIKRRDCCQPHNVNQCGMQMRLCHEITVAKTFTWCIISMATIKPLFSSIITMIVVQSPKKYSHFLELFMFLPKLCR